jgi:flagellar basal-body rod protein FlgC
MKMTGVDNIFQIAGRSLGAQQVRLNTIASNLANAGAKVGSKAEAYQPLKAVFEAVMSDRVGNIGLAGVEVAAVVALQRDPKRIHEPDHPLADEEGFVYESAVNVQEELVEMMEASRQYQNNLKVVSTIRTLMLRTVDMGK